MTPRPRLPGFNLKCNIVYTHKDIHIVKLHLVAETLKVTHSRVHQVSERLENIYTF